MTGHEDGGGEMISGSGRHSDKSVGLCQVEAHRLGCTKPTGDQLPTARVSFVSSRLGIAGIDQIPYEFRHRGTRLRLVSLRRSKDNDRTINDIDKRSRSSRRRIRRRGGPACVA